VPVFIIKKQSAHCKHVAGRVSRPANPALTMRP
jgi:hypothetical protein